MKSLSEILDCLAITPAEPSYQKIAITDIHENSNKVTKGSMFCACAGQNHHGMQYLDEVLGRKVAAILYDPNGYVLDSKYTNAPVPIIAVTNLNQHLATLAKF
ncbi:MAG: hypothetical protein COB50_05110, partial [Thiotrichales bacterium]